MGMLSRLDVIKCGSLILKVNWLTQDYKEEKNYKDYKFTWNIDLYVEVSIWIVMLNSFYEYCVGKAGKGILHFDYE